MGGGVVLPSFLNPPTSHFQAFWNSVGQPASLEFGRTPQPWGGMSDLREAFGRLIERFRNEYLNNFLEGGLEVAVPFGWKLWKLKRLKGGIVGGNQIISSGDKA